jgi:hypothetical protein
MKGLLKLIFNQMIMDLQEFLKLELSCNKKEFKI